MKPLEPQDIIMDGKKSYRINHITKNYSSLNGGCELTIQAQETNVINSLDYEEKFKIHRQMLIVKNILTKEEIEDLIESGKIMNKLVE